MSFDSEPMSGSRNKVHKGHIDYRLSRNLVVNEVRSGRLSRLEVCDAQSELLRVANNYGNPTKEDCPICEQEKTVLVSFVFGSGLPAKGRSITSPFELSRFSLKRGDFTCYVIEVCQSCSWNHLVRSFRVGDH